MPTSSHANHDQTDDAPDATVRGYFVTLSNRLDKTDFNLLDRLLLAGLAYRWLIMFVSVLFAVLFFALSFKLEKTYRSELLMIPAASENASGSAASALGGLGSLGALTGISLGDSGGIKHEALAILQSRAFLGDFIQEYNLLPVLFSGSYDEQAADWKPEETVPTVLDGIEFMRADMVKVSDSVADNLVTFSIDWKDPQQAADWANELVARLNDKMRQSKIGDSLERRQFLEQELKKTSNAEIQSGIFRLIESEIKNVMLANVRQEYAFRVIDPAVPPEEDQYFSPNRVSLALIGLLLGGALAFGLAFMLSLRKSKASS